MAATFTKINNDVNGNPRVVVHFLNLNTQEELDRQGDAWIPVGVKYALALDRARKIGGKKYSTKKYAGGIVFQCYSTDELQKEIERVTGRSDQY